MSYKQMPFEQMSLENMSFGQMRFEQTPCKILTDVTVPRHPLQSEFPVLVFLLLSAIYASIIQCLLLLSIAMANLKKVEFFFFMFFAPPTTYVPPVCCLH
jgi:hypothetical protein